MTALVRLAIVAALVGQASAQTLSGQCEPDPENDETTIFAELGSTVTPVSSASGNVFHISIEVKSNQLILGLRVFFAYLDSNNMESTDGVNIISTSFENNPTIIALFGLPLNFDPIRADKFVLEAGSLFTNIGGSISLLSIPQSCSAENPPIKFPSCSSVTAETVIEAVVEFPPGVMPDDIFLSGPDGFPQADISACILGTTDNVELPAPVPFPPPLFQAPPPDGITLNFFPPLAPPMFPPGMLSTIKSDPHIIGFQDQHLNFFGTPGSVYNILTDSMMDSEESYTVNALIGQGYRTGIDFDGDTLRMTTAQPHGTWITALGINYGGQSVIVNSGPRDMLPSQDTEVFKSDTAFPVCSSDMSSTSTLSPESAHPFCFRHDVFFNDEQLNLVGNYSSDVLPTGDQVRLELKNSKSFSRVISSSQQITASIDIVPPPTVWLVNEGDAPRYSHINFAAQHVIIFTPSGILGDTAWPTIQDGDVVIDSQSSRENTHDFSRSYEEKYRVGSLLHISD